MRLLIAHWCHCYCSHWKHCLLTLFNYLPIKLFGKTVTKSDLIFCNSHLKICGMILPYGRIWINIETNILFADANIIVWCVCCYWVFLSSWIFGSLWLDCVCIILIVIVIVNVIIVDLCLCVCGWCTTFIVIVIIIVIVNVMLSLWICASLCVVGVRFLRKCSNLLHSHPIQALNWIGRLYYQSLWLYTKVKYTVLNSQKNPGGWKISSACKKLRSWTTRHLPINYDVKV